MIRATLPPPAAPRFATVGDYHQVLLASALTPDQWRIWSALSRQPAGLTAAEIDNLVSQGNHDPGIPERISELQVLGVVQQVVGEARPAKEEPLLQRLGEALRREIKAGVAESDPAACVARLTSAAREMGLT